jgi:hypothetical protein
MSRIAVASLPDGRLQLWASTGQGLLSTWKLTTDPNAGWSGWADAGPLSGNVTSLAVAPLPDGRLQLWAGTGQGLFTTWKLTTDPNADWSGWADAGPLPGNVTCLAVAPLPDGRLQLWAGTGQGLFTTWKLTSDPNADWSGWADAGPLPGNVTSLAVAPLPDGRLQLWAGTGQGLFTTWKLTTDPNADWSGWADAGPLSGNVTSLAVARLPDGRQQLWAGTGQGLFTTWKLTSDPNADWSAWSDFLAEVGPLSGSVTSLAVAPLEDGRLQLWAGTEQKFFSTWKVSTDPNADWSGWSDFSAEVEGTVEATLTGTVSFSIPGLNNPISSPIATTLLFVAGGTVQFSPLPPITKIFGEDTVTVTQTGGGAGTFNKADGSMSVPLSLHFHHSLVFAGQSDVTFVLTTGSSSSPSGKISLTGSPLDSTTGLIELVGASRFRGGILGGKDCGVTITGKLTPIP